MKTWGIESESTSRAKPTRRCPDSGTGINGHKQRCSPCADIARDTRRNEAKRRRYAERRQEARDALNATLRRAIVTIETAADEELQQVLQAVAGLDDDLAVLR